MPGGGGWPPRPPHRDRGLRKTTEDRPRSLTHLSSARAPHDEQGLQPPQPEGVDVKEVGSEETVGSGFEERGPLCVDRPPASRGAESGGAQDTADGGCADRVTEAVDLAVHAAEAPQRIVGADPDDQIAEFFGDRWAPSRGGLGPFLLYQALVPGEQRTWGDEPVAAKGSRQEPRECGQQRSVRPGRLRDGHSSAQHGDLMVQDEYFGVLGRDRPEQQSKPSEGPRGEQADRADEYED